VFLSSPQEEAIAQRERSDCGKVGQALEHESGESGPACRGSGFHQTMRTHRRGRQGCETVLLRHGRLGGAALVPGARCGLRAAGCGLRQRDAAMKSPASVADADPPQDKPDRSWWTRLWGAVHGPWVTTRLCRSSNAAGGPSTPARHTRGRFTHDLPLKGVQDFRSLSSSGLASRWAGPLWRSAAVAFPESRCVPRFRRNVPTALPIAGAEVWLDW